MNLPKKTRKRDGHRVESYIENDDIEVLKSDSVNIAQLIRDTIHEAAEEVRNRRRLDKLKRQL